LVHKFEPKKKSNDILTSNFQQLLVTTFFLSFYWTITIEREKGRERIKVHWEYERELSQKLLKNGYSNIISQKKIGFGS